MTEVESSAAPKLLLARAQFQIHMGQFNAACNDANHALTRQRETSSTTLTSQANQIIGRYGVFQERVHSNNPNLTQWGVEAGEALLRVGQLACRQGQLTRAFSLCSQSVNIFKFFDLRCGLMRSLYCCAKISLSMGNLNLAEHCIDQIEFYASKCRDSKMDFRVFRLRSDVYLANKQFGNAIALATEFIARPEIAVVNSMCFRAMAVIAWAHYGQGVISMAEAVCEYLLIETKKSKDLRLELSLKTLSALVFARTGRQNMASKAVYSAVDLIASKQPLGDTQTDLINIAELAHYLKRDDVAAAMLNLIDVFARNSDVEIRPWVKARVQILTKTMVGFKVDTGKKFLVMSAADIIKELAKDRDKTMRHSHLRYGESVVI